jgi:hypothetical protein
MEPMRNAVSKGCELQEMMLANTTAAGKLFSPARSTAESAFNDVKDLGRTGYV